VQRGLGLESMQMWKAGTQEAGVALLAGYRWVSKLRGYNLAAVPMKGFWKVLTSLGFGVRKGKAGNVRVVPDREAYQRRLATLFGAQGGGSDG
jgi:hypothetical protein